MEDKPNNRNRIIDGLRGFSLLGILMANMLIFQYGIWGKDKMELYAPAQTDTVVHRLVTILIEGSFMPIFTFLFGYGMIKMKESLESKGLKPKRCLIRRFLMLFAIGLLHSHYLWEGDILGFYGMMGFFLLLFMNRTPRTLLVWGTVLLCLFGLLGLVPEDGKNASAVEADIRMEAYVKQTITVYGTGTYEEIQHHRETEDPLGEDSFLIVAVLLMAPFMTAPLFLFGMYAAKRRWFDNPEGERASYRNNMLLFLPAGLLLKMLKHVLPGYWWSGAGELFGGNLLALGFIFAFAWLCSRAKTTVWLERFEAVGKLSLTNYLVQSVICTTLFYGYGFGWFGKLGVLAGCGMAIVIYAVQLITSKLYLTRYHSGPVERLLRMWTYFTITGKSKRRKESPAAGA
ncbi:DUF418 domain-containing protein [Paenibacillus contaminans]|uniref:DUF418 domain-containing protein n=1 Tax=Paenibacillus contaminans TaxID=450362 RepID=A0A329MSL4_9BACL|nr:DUF418 domain-containing protein [Paenibacillus contaminans]RAV22961.1 hypothetical protein DQG23_01790 [Paenibacillus contaminans]